jgi:hypothetical protein
VTIYEVIEVHHLHAGRDRGTSFVVPFRRTLCATRELAEAERERQDLRSSDPEVIAARHLVGIDTVEIRVGPVEVLEA